MSNKNDPPKTDEEIEEWIEEREEAAQDDYDELMEELERMQEAEDYSLTIAGFWQGTWLP